METFDKTPKSRLEPSYDAWFRLPFSFRRKRRKGSQAGSEAEAMEGRMLLTGWPPPVTCLP